MSNPGEPKPASTTAAETPADMAPQPSAPPAADVENQAPEMGPAVSSILERWKREDLLNKALLTARGLAFLFSLLAFIIMASNKHGDWQDFDKYEEYKYALAIAILSALYTAVQILRHIHELSTGKHPFPQRMSALIDFSGDQITSYLLISAVSSAVPLTNGMRRAADNIFTDSSASAVSMEFLAFLALALSALISGFKFSNQSYI